MPNPHDIAFIGGGNMAASLIGGLLAQGTDSGRIWVSDCVEAKRQALKDRFGVSTSPDNAHAASRAGTVVLAVKPRQMEEATRAIACTSARHEPLIISVAAGVRIRHIRAWLGHDAAIVRTMPNTPALVGLGATALFANARVSNEGRRRAAALLGAAGLSVWVEDEGLLDAVTAVSGSGPAYFFLLMELIEESGVALGLDRDTARALTLQTALGAARMACEGDEAPAALRARVTSAGGTTERALETLVGGGVGALFETALRAARDRSVELGRAFGNG